LLLSEAEPESLLESEFTSEPLLLSGLLLESDSLSLPEVLLLSEAEPESLLESEFTSEPLLLSGVLFESEPVSLPEVELLSESEELSFASTLTGTDVSSEDPSGYLTLTGMSALSPGVASAGGV
ncbi:hypothetical protein G6W75_14725, partial [Staphylococcus sciuri]